MVTFKRDQTLLRAGTLFACSLLLGAALSVARDNTSLASGMQGPPDDPEPDPLLTSDRCIACHKGVATSTGTDVSIGYDWRASMMANSARDPYWQAAVRREIVDHPQASQEIQALCSRCHMPMASEVARSEGRVSSVFDHLPVANTTDETESALSADGVSCAVCHRMESDALGTDASFSGGFRIDPRIDGDSRPVFGPFEPDPGGAGIMHSATGFRPEEAKHIQSSELCASCHTVLTHAIGLDSGEGPEFPEQVPYLEWRASSFAARNTCQDCHMPLVEEDVPVTRVLGRARAEVSRHVFRGGNFFMLRMLNRYRDELGVVALPAELAMAAARTEEHLRGATATATVTSAEVGGDRLVAQVDVRNLAGHKFPTAYPSRRAWLQLVVSDGQGDAVFESGAFAADGRVVGDDHDSDGSLYEPHYSEIHAPEQVQIYQAVMADSDGSVTTGLSSAARWVKDNRLLPDGFDAVEAGTRAAVYGSARSDSDFSPGGDRVRYVVPVDAAAGPFTVTATLWFQPIAYRWAENLADYDTFETQRFVRYYREMASSSAVAVASHSLTTAVDPGR